MIHKYGLGLWNSLPGTILVEGGLFAAGFWYYLKSTKALDSVGRFALWAFGGVLIAIYVASLVMTPPGDPNKVSFIAVIQLTSQLLLVAGAYWIDDHRKVV
jgi:hypothetical protein